jgi:hypothetical protein
MTIYTYVRKTEREKRAIRDYLLEKQPYEGLTRGLGIHARAAVHRGSYNRQNRTRRHSSIKRETANCNKYEKGSHRSLRTLVLRILGWAWSLHHGCMG